MSKAQILAELSQLSPRDRAEILDNLWALEEKGGPTEFERIALDEAQRSYDARPLVGSPWREAVARLHQQP